MKSLLNLILICVFTFSICSNALSADEEIFEDEIKFEESLSDEETVFENPANGNEEEYMTEDSFVSEEEYVTDDSSFYEDEISRQENQNEELVGDDNEAIYEDMDLLIDDSYLYEDEIISNKTITDIPSYENVIASGTCGDNLTWKLTGKDGNMVLTISGSGEMNVSSIYPWKDYQSSIVKIIIRNGVISIGACAFSECSNLTNISIPNSITSIGREAFKGCSSLVSITIPDNVTDIGYNAFGGCSSLTSITIPSNVISIGDDTFYNCTSLLEINVSKGNSAYKAYDGVLFDSTGTILICCPGGKTGEYKIPDSVTSIGTVAFACCRSLTDIIIPNSVTNIDEAAFTFCDKLINITIPNSVTSISEETFQGCSSLISVTIPNSITNIGFSAFYKCVSLINVAIPDSVTYIDEGAFESCSSLTSIIIPNSVTYIDEYALWDCHNVTIYGYSGSYAEIYAKENNIPFKSLSTVFVSKITPDKAEYNLFVGATSTIKSTVTPTDAKDETLNYKSDNTNIAKVSKNGKITAVNVGTATITVSANDGSGVSASCKVNVYNKPTAMLNITRKTIYTKGKPHTFTLIPTVANGELESVTYSSSDPKKAYVAKNGKVTGKRSGTATITATVKMKNECGHVTEKLACKVTVKKPTLTVSPKSVSLKKGKKKKLTVEATPKGTITYTSSNKKIATVSKTGKIKAKKNGNCTITVECNGVKIIVNVTVMK